MSLDGIFITQRRNYTVVICHLDILIVFGKNFIMSSAKKKNLALDMYYMCIALYVSLLYVKYT